MDSTPAVAAERPARPLRRAGWGNGAAHATLAVASGALMAMPWQVEAAPPLVAVAIWLAVVPVFRLAEHDVPRDAGTHAMDPRLALLVAVLLASLVRPAAGGLVLAGWLARRAMARVRPMPAARSALGDVVLPALVAWVAFGGARGLDAGALAAVDAASALLAWLAESVAVLGVIGGWAFVFASARMGPDTAIERRMLTAACGWLAVVVAVAVLDNVVGVLAAVAIGLGGWAVGERAAISGSARRADLALLGLLVTGGCLALLP